MKKLTVLAITLIIANCLSICSLAYEATEDEKAAIACALNYFNTYCVNIYFNYDNDLLIHTIDHLDNDSELRKEIIEKAKEYEDEIRKYHYYYFEDKNVTDKSVYEQKGHILYGSDPAKDSLALQYNNTPIDEVIASFPVFIKKKAEYETAYNRNIDYQDGGLYLISPESVIVSESGFAYVNMSDMIRFLLYKYKPANQVETYGGWIICDIFENGDGYGRKYRFSSKELDVEKVLAEEGISPVSENDTQNDSTAENNSDSMASPQERGNKADTAPEDSKPINYIPWAVCAVEGVAIIALVIALVVKKKK